MATLTPTQSETAARMAEAARTLVLSLADDQKRRATFPMSDNVERRDWAYYPRNTHGLAVLDMAGPQEKLLFGLLESALSIPGQSKVGQIMSLENLLDRLEGHRRDDRNYGRYWISFFNSPYADSWGWRFEGHHVSLNFTLAGAQIVGCTPCFFGSNPAEVTHNGNVVSRPLAEEEETARTLLMSLRGDLRSRAIVADVAPVDFVMTNLPRVPAKKFLPGEEINDDFPLGNRGGYKKLTEAQADGLTYDPAAPRGVGAMDMNDHERDCLTDLIKVYLDRMPEDVAQNASSILQPSNLGQVHFAWAGELEHRKPHYYRLQGPSFLVEYDDIQNDTNHIHAVWRDPENDFGEDLLRRHYAQAHRA